MEVFHQSHFCVQLVTILLVLVLCYTSVTATTTSSLVKDFGGVNETHRRILHQPLYPESPPPSEETPPPSPPSPDSERQPFFHEEPIGYNSAPPPPPPTVSSSNGSFPYPTATQPNKPAKRVAIAISVGIVTLGMLSALAFFLYRYRARHSGETLKLVGGSSERVLEESRMPPQSSLLFIGTVEPSSLSRRAVMEVNGENEANGSPYKLTSVKISDGYHPSPELQPLPPLSREFNNITSSAAISSSDENHRAFYRPGSLSRASSEDSTQNSVGNNKSSVPHSKRTSPRARLSSSSPDIIKTIIPSSKQPTPPPPPPSRLPPENSRVELSQRVVGYIPQRPTLPLPPPPLPNMMLLQSISKQSPHKTEHTVPPSASPPPPPSPLPLT